MFFFSLFLCLILGISLSSLCVTLPVRKASSVFIISLGIRVGLVVSGMIYGYFSLFLRKLYHIEILFETGMTIVLVNLCLRKQKLKNLISPFFSNRKITVVDSMIVVYVLSWIFFFIYRLYLVPNGGWDSWAMWNLKARALFFSNGNTAVTLQNGYAHSDYPLLLPYINARFMKDLGRFSDTIPRITEFLFYISILFLIISSITLLKNKKIAYFSTVVFFALPLMREIFVMQYADGPLTSLYTALVVLFIVNERYQNMGHQRTNMILGGILTGSILMMKNEGLLLLLSFFAGYVLLRLTTKRMNLFLKELFFIGLGCIFYLLLIIYTKINYQLQNDIITVSLFSRLGQVMDFSRIFTILKAILKEVCSKDWIYMPFLGTIAVCILGLDKKQVKPAGLIILFPFFISLLGYFMIYLITPYDLSWHLSRSADRVMLHILPSYGLFLILVSSEIQLQAKGSVVETSKN